MYVCLVCGKFFDELLKTEYLDNTRENDVYVYGEELKCPFCGSDDIVDDGGYMEEERNKYE